MPWNFAIRSALLPTESSSHLVLRSSLDSFASRLAFKVGSAFIHVTTKYGPTHLQKTVENTGYDTKEPEAACSVCILRSVVLREGYKLDRISLVLDTC